MVNSVLVSPRTCWLEDFGDGRNVDDLWWAVGDGWEIGEGEVVDADAEFCREIEEAGLSV